MKYLIDFLENKDIEKTEVFIHLKCTKEEALVLQYMVRQYVDANIDINANEVLNEIFGNKEYIHLKKIYVIKNLIDLGWLVQGNFSQLKITEYTLLELYNSTITLSTTFLKLLEDGNLELILPEVSPYNDHLEYLKDQFFRIELYQKLSQTKNVNQNSPGINRLKAKLQMLEARIVERLKVSTNELVVESIFKEHMFDFKEQIIFLALLKEEYSGEFESLREMNTLIALVSLDEYERIKNRAYLEEGAKLIESGIINYDEMFTAFGGITRNFYISEDILQNIIHPDKEKKNKKIKLDMLIAEQDLFELIEPKTNLGDVIMNKKTTELMNSILKQLDKTVIARLKEWGIKDKKKGIDAKIILYGPPGTGKTMTALSLAKSLKKQVLNFDCSKILSKYVGESEKNVRKIFDTYKDLCNKTKTEPLLLLNEADQFLSARSTENSGSAEKMHNQMQNIFLEQIEKFSGLLVATTNMLENIDSAFSRRFDYKIEFKKPDLKERLKLWRKSLPENALYEADFNIEFLARYPLTGGQIQVILKNTALKVAIKDEPIFTMEDFKSEIERETKGSFGEPNSVGFLN